MGRQRNNSPPDDIVARLDRIEAKLDRLVDRITAEQPPARSWYNCKEAAELLGYKTARSVQLLIDRGELGATLTPRGYQISRQSLQDYMTQVEG